MKKETESDKALQNEAFSTWLQNKEEVANLNKELQSSSSKWHAELNHFATLPSEDFKKRVLMPPMTISERPRPKTKPQRRAHAYTDNIPDAFDWRTDGDKQVVTPVKDQGYVGTCWTFSTIENIESQWALAGNDLVSLSEEFLVDCDGNHDDEHADCSIFGGWPYLAYEYIIGAGGVPTEEAWPYCAGDGSCYPCMLGPISECGPPPYYCDRDIPKQCKSMTPTAKIYTWTDIDKNETAMVEALLEFGPLSALLDADTLQYYKGGIWDGGSGIARCTKQSLNHAILIVGYGEEDGEKYWTIKNSWGASWGEDGYFRMVRGEGACGINLEVTSSLA